MPIIKDGRIIDDPWVLIDDDMDIPSAADVIVPLEVFKMKAERLSNHTGRLGLFISNDIIVEDYRDEIAKADLIVLELPAFTDGRAYSQARVLREHLKFDKELRVKGDVIADQAAYLKTCGFDSYDLDGEFDANVWQRSLSMMSTGYQRSYRTPLTHRTL